LQLVLGWPVRVLVIALLIFSLVVDGAGYIYRISNHYPLTGPVPGLPPEILGSQLYLHRGLDLSGGTDLVLQMDTTGPVDQTTDGTGLGLQQPGSDLQQKTIDVIQKRVNELGVSEPVIVPQGKDRIEVQLAGVPADKAQQVIGTTAQLVVTTWVKDPSVTGGPNPGYKPQFTQIRSDMLTTAYASLDQTQGWIVNTTYNSAGGDILSKLTQTAAAACPGAGCPESRITYWLNLTPDDIANWNERADKLYTPYDQGGKLVTDPQVDSAFSSTSFISGRFTADKAKSLALLLNSGALPVNLTVISSTDVGASLGADSIKRSLAAGLLGLIVVVIFMMAFYRLPGFLASIALLFYAALVLALFKVIPVTLTLAGLAGFVLSVGMAVDANVLIFERFKEEVRSGRTIGAAVEAAVRRAWPAVRDSNTATLITSAILVFAGTGPVKGFAVTLMLGVACSLVSSIVITHNLLAIVLNTGSRLVRRPEVMGVERGRA
jgi:preprotein translocase subunit SecD